MKFEDAINYYGNQSKLAKALGITKQSVGNWVIRLNGVIPLVRQYQIEVLTKGALKADKK